MLPFTIGRFLELVWPRIEATIHATMVDLDLGLGLLWHDRSRRTEPLVFSKRSRSLTMASQALLSVASALFAVLVSCARHACMHSSELRLKATLCASVPPTGLEPFSKEFEASGWPTFAGSSMLGWKDLFFQERGSSACGAGLSFRRDRLGLALLNFYGRYSGV